MQRIILLLFVIISQFSCSNENTNSSSNPTSSDYAYSFEYKDPLCTDSLGNCSKVALDIKADNLPESVKNQILQSSLSALKDLTAIESKTDLMDFSKIFISNFNKKEVSAGRKIPVDLISVNVDAFKNNNDCWSATLDIHKTVSSTDYSFTKAIVISSKGEIIHSFTLVKDTTESKKQIIEKLKERHGIKGNVNLIEGGYLISNDELNFPSNAYVIKDSLEVIYNIFEIASADEGLIKLKIPLK